MAATKMPIHRTDSGSAIVEGSGLRPLRILEVASSLPRWGGTEIHLLNLSTELRQRGHEVTVLCQPESFVEGEARRRQIPQVQAICRHQTDIVAFPQLRSAITSQRFDVVHVHWSPDYVMPPLVSRLSGVPAVLMSHHSPYPMKKGLVKNYLFRTYLFDRVIALSDSVRARLLADGIPSEKLVTVHHGIDVEKFREITRSAREVRAEWGIPEDAVIIGIVGRVSKEKGIHTFIRAIAKARTDTPGVPLYGLIIGDGPDVTVLQEEIRTAQLETTIRMVGFRSDINNAINALDVHVLASVWAEPCAAVVQQAMALGKPVIGTNIGGTPELMQGEQTGILVPPGDVDALAAAVISLATDPQKRRAMGEAGQTRVDALFTQQRMVDRNESLYYEILRSKRIPLESR